MLRTDFEPQTLTFDALVARACALADAGCCANWQEIADALEADGARDAKALVGADVLLTILLNFRCDRAKSAAGVGSQAHP